MFEFVVLGCATPDLRLIFYGMEEGILLLMMGSNEYGQNRK